jgi:hypothetical protein
MRQPARLARALWLARLHLTLPLALPGLWHLVVLLWIFRARLDYPIDAEWMEGGSLYHAHRWLHGQPVYGPPSQGFVPFGYPPGHFVVLAAASALFGLDYATGRAVSILSFLSICVVLGHQCWRQLPRGPAAVALGALAVGLAAAGFPVTGGWYDLCRNDTLALAFPVLAAGLVSQGWFITWVTLMKDHKLALGRLTTGPLQVLAFAPHLYGVPLLVGVLLGRRWLSARAALWAAMLLAAVPASLLPHIKWGGFLNNLLPLVVLAGPTTLLLLGDLLNGLRRRRRAAEIALWATLASAGLLLLLRRYDPSPYLVTAAQRQRAVALNQAVRELAGGVLTPLNPFLAAGNGIATPQIHAIAQWDAFAAGMTDQHLRRRIEATTARWMIVDRRMVLDRRLDLAEHYRPERALDGVPTMVGFKTAPTFLLRRLP